jgi:hypothetical protein
MTGYKLCCHGSNPSRSKSNGYLWLHRYLHLQSIHPSVHLVFGGGGVQSVMVITHLNIGHALAQAVSCWPLTADGPVCTQVGPRGIYAEKSDTGTGFSQSSLVFSCFYHFTIAYISWGMNSWWP